MRFGIALESFTYPGKILDVGSIYTMAERAEALGFDSVWTWDHLLLGSRRVFPVLDSLTTLASIGARTSKIKAGDERSHPCPEKSSRRGEGSLHYSIHDERETRHRFGLGVV